MGSLGNKLYKQIYYDVPCYAEEDIAQLLPMEEPNNSVLLAQAKFDIEDLQITGDIILFFKVCVQRTHGQLTREQIGKAGRQNVSRGGNGDVRHLLWECLGLEKDCKQ